MGKAVEVHSPTPLLLSARPRRERRNPPQLHLPLQLPFRIRLQLRIQLQRQPHFDETSETSETNETNENWNRNA